MVRVFVQSTQLTPENPLAEKEYDRMLSIADQDRAKRHQLVDAVEQADIILFVGSEHADMRTLKRNAIYRKYRERCFVFYAGDHIFPFLPGFFPSIEKRCYADSQTRSAPYLRVVEESCFDQIDRSAKRELLFSFRGNASTSPIRSEILNLKSERAKLCDTGAASYSAGNRRDYIDEIEKSSFVLCPRGGGTSSFRIFECMRMGRVPVIISDQWVEPAGPDWDSFSVRIPQSKISEIPSILSSRESDAIKMGEAARKTWEQFFDPSVYFDYLVQQCIEMQASRTWLETLRRIWNRRWLATPLYFRRFVLPGLVAFKHKVPGS